LSSTSSYYISYGEEYPFLYNNRIFSRGKKPKFFAQQKAKLCCHMSEEVARKIGAMKADGSSTRARSNAAGNGPFGVFQEFLVQAYEANPPPSKGGKGRWENLVKEARKDTVAALVRTKGGKTVGANEIKKSIFVNKSAEAYRELVNMVPTSVDDLREIMGRVRPYVTKENAEYVQKYGSQAGSSAEAKVEEKEPEEEQKDPVEQRLPDPYPEGYGESYGEPSGVGGSWQAEQARPREFVETKKERATRIKQATKKAYSFEGKSRYAHGVRQKLTKIKEKFEEARAKGEYPPELLMEQLTNLGVDTLELELGVDLKGALEDEQQSDIIGNLIRKAGGSFQDLVMNRDDRKYLGGSIGGWRALAQSEEPVDALDAIAKDHDMAFLLASSRKDKNERAQIIRSADQMFLDRTGELRNRYLSRMQQLRAIVQGTPLSQQEEREFRQLEAMVKDLNYKNDQGWLMSKREQELLQQSRERLGELQELQKKSKGVALSEQDTGELLFYKRLEQDVSSARQAIEVKMGMDQYGISPTDWTTKGVKRLEGDSRKQREAELQTKLSAYNEVLAKVPYLREPGPEQFVEEEYLGDLPSFEPEEKKDDPQLAQGVSALPPQVGIIPGETVIQQQGSGIKKVAMGLEDILSDLQKMNRQPVIGQAQTQDIFSLKPVTGERNMRPMLVKGDVAGIVKRKEDEEAENMNFYANWKFVSSGWGNGNQQALPDQIGMPFKNQLLRAQWRNQDYMFTDNFDVGARDWYKQTYMPHRRRDEVIHSKRIAHTYGIPMIRDNQTHQLPTRNGSLPAGVGRPIHFAEETSNGFDIYTPNQRLNARSTRLFNGDVVDGRRV
jgi:hypothetical protein